MAYLGTIIAQPTLRMREARQRTLIKAQISGEQLPEQTVIVRNVSRHGLGMSTPGLRPRAGEQIAVEFTGGLRAAGQVAWIDGKTFGVRLDHPISLAEIEQAAQRQQDIRNSLSAWQVEERYVRAPEPPSVHCTRFV